MGCDILLVCIKIDLGFSLNHSTTESNMAFTNRMGMTMRQALRRAIEASSAATHLVVKFKEDETISMVSVKRVVDLDPASLRIFSECAIRWSNNSIYKATVLAMGKLFFTFKIQCSFCMCACSIITLEYVVYTMYILHVGDEKKMKEAEKTAIDAMDDSENNPRKANTSKRPRATSKLSTDKSPPKKRSKKKTTTALSTTALSSNKYNYKEVSTTNKFTCTCTCNSCLYHH